jgi:hypothetical protein
MLSIVGAVPGVTPVSVVETVRLMDELMDEYTRRWRRRGPLDVPTPRVGAAHWCGVINYVIAEVDDRVYQCRRRILGSEVRDTLVEYLTTC